MRRILLLFLLLFPAAHVQAQAPPPEARVTQVDTSRYPEVTLYVGVTDASGRPVPGLPERAFAITEDNQPVTLSGFSGGAGAITTVLVIDHSASMAEQEKLVGARDAAQAFVRQMRPGDQTALIAFDDQPTLVQPFTGDTARLDTAIRRITPGSSTALYDSLIAGVDLLKGVTGRRALLLLTDGRDCRQLPCIGDPASRATLDEAIAQTVQAGVAVQVIGLGDRSTADLSAGIDETVLRRIADESGGSYFYTPAADQLADLYRRLSANMQQEYQLTYRSPRPFYDGTRRDIRVQVGGAAPVAGGYVERHLINVHSDPLVGLVLLLPILAALLLPALLRRPKAAGTLSQPGARPDQALGTAAPPAAPGAWPADGPTILQPAGIAVLPPAVARCQSCDAALAPADARFCSVCGTRQPPAPAPARRFFCDQCGRPLRDGARFCSTCGTSAPLPQLATGDR
jgi:VWFA-related protein